MADKKKKKNIFANSVMVAIIAMIVVGGILGVGYLRGWFGDKGADTAVLSDVRGIVNMTRSGVTYPVEQDTPLRAGDVITCTPGGTAAIHIDTGSALAIGEQAAMTVEEPSSRGFAADVTNGELFAFVTGEKAKPVTLTFDGKSVEVEHAIVSLSRRAGAQNVNVYYGSVGEAQAGQVLNWVQDELSVDPLQIGSLNAFSVVQLRAANTVAACCFTNAELDEMEAARKAERDAQSAAAMSEALSELDLAYECTVTIVCDTILDNWDKLETAKQEFVPEDGVILPATTVPFAEGETSFDVLKRVCDAYGIQIEYSWTPLYNSYYVEGINHLYEFDCGAESGWMYKVNGWFPNYGASSYVMQEGDSMVWSYTCVGLGVDVGGQAW
ncbi:MAG: DUF4430 domain-containing protein [Oscillospiraceae bacterium]|nr:DUF4430 domain-containing protein [Oscillospiraceae bacterium]